MAAQRGDAPAHTAAGTLSLCKSGRTMRTLLIRGAHEPPVDLREIVEAGSTEVAEVAQAEEALRRDADRVVEWNGHELLFENRRLRWPEDEDELRMLFQTGG